MEIINTHWRQLIEKMKSLINEQQKSYQNGKICYIFLKRLQDKHAKDKNIVKLGTITIIQVNTEVLHMAFVI